MRMSLRSARLVVALIVSAACGGAELGATSTTDLTSTTTHLLSTSSSVGEQPSSTPGTAPTALESKLWAKVVDHRVVGRVFPIVVWTGTEVVVWGGEKPSEGEWHDDGAAFNPATGVWRELADSPLAPRSEHVAVWTGSEILICCGRIVGGGIAAAAYHPASDQWREIAAPPLSPAFGEAIWTGREMLVFGGVGGGGTTNLTGAAAYDPVDDSWRRLADLPYGLERTADSTIGGGVIYAWPSPLAGVAPGPLLYDIAADEWRPLPDPPDHAPSSPSLVWTGDNLFAYGVEEHHDRVTGTSVLFDTATETWSHTTPAPLEPVQPSEGVDGSQKAAWTGDEVIIWTGWVGTNWDEPITRVVAYDPEADSWRLLEPAPVEGQGLWHEPIIWTGSQLITYTEPMLIYTP